MGVVTPIGVGVEAFREALRKGTSGVGPITRFEPKGLRTRRAFEVKDFTPLHGTHLLDPFIQYALFSAAQAVEDAKFDSKGVDPFRIGIVVGSSKGGLHSLAQLRERFLKRRSAILAARIYANLLPNFACQWIARRWKIKGPAKCFVTACATGTTSIVEAARLVEAGDVDYAFAGASDASLVPFLVAGYEQMRVLAPEDMYPFDRRRKGFLLGEGAGIVFLETLESARARGARPYAEVLGCALGSDCFHPLSFDPQGEALARTLKTLLERTRMSARDIDYINLHGTGTRDGDRYETAQLKKVFGKQAYSISMSSTKSMMGHMLGASGAVEVVASVLAIQEGFVPPTLNLEKEDPACDLNYTPCRAEVKKVHTALSISMGFGGHIAVIALRRV